MRGPLVYLISTRFKNQLRSLFKSPGKLIYILIMVALLAFTLFNGNTSREVSGDLRDISELSAGVTGLYTVMFLLFANNGFNQGSSMFTMSDINLIFPAPLHTQKVLFYGLFRQIGTSLMLGLFFLFQYAWLNNVYGIDYGVIVLIMTGYALTVFLGQITAMLIYSMTSANEVKKKYARIVFFGIYILFALYLGISVLSNKTGFLEQLVSTVNGTVMNLMPVSGWIGAMVAGILLLHMKSVILGAVLFSVYLIAMIRILLYTNKDYYEDVLKTAEITHSAITARKEGLMSEVVPQNVRIGKMGIENGYGAVTFFFKHKIENRRSKVFLLAPTTLIFAAFAMFFSFVMKNVGISAVFIMTTYMQIFSVALGRFNRELTKPYIYLIPEPAFKKLIYSLAEGLPSHIVEAIVIFVPVSLIMGLGPLESALCIIARISFAGLFTAANIAEQRIFGSIGSKALMIFFYLFICVIIAIPGIALAMILSVGNIFFLTVDATIFFSLTVCNIPMTLLILFLCRNVLEYAELNNK